ADQHTTHGWRSRFLEVRLRPILAHKLADLELTQLLDHPRPDEQRNQKRRQRRKCRAESEIAEDAEWVEEREQLFVEQPVKQGASKSDMRRDLSLILQARGRPSGMQKQQLPIVCLLRLGCRPRRVVGS